jgi:SAM-dependent methyltransferase
MGFYARFILPKIVDFTCGLKPTMRQRAKVVPLARGRVLEVGFGSGLNLACYDAAKVERLWALEPSAEMWALAQPRVRGAGFPVEWLSAPAEGIPLSEGTADTVVVTFTLCTIPHVERALGEMARVLRPGGELVFCEHGAAPDESVRRWQERLNPVWRALAGGCNLNRPIPSLLERGGFQVRELNTMYLPGFRPATFNYWGRAVGAVPQG